MQSTNDQTRGLCGVIHELENQNKDLRERILNLEKQLRQSKKNISKINKKKKHQSENDLSDYIVSIQTKNEQQTKEIELLTKEKETLLNLSETQFQNLQKKTKF